VNKDLVLHGGANTVLTVTACGLVDGKWQISTQQSSTNHQKIVTGDCSYTKLGAKCKFVQ